MTHSPVVAKVPPTRSMQNYYMVACTCGWKGAGYVKGREGANAGYRLHVEQTK